MSLFRTLARPATAVVLAAALALSPAAAKPARADQQDLLVAGALAAILGGLAASSIKTQSSGGLSFSAGTPSYLNPGHNARNSYNSRHVYKPQPVQPRHNYNQPRYNGSKRLPTQCVIRVGSGANTGIYFGNTCLNRNYDGARYLPRNCKTTMVNRGNGNQRQVYSGACLQAAGYDVYGPRRHFN